MHQVLVRAIITGFGLSLGAAIYKKVAKRIGFFEEDPPRTPVVERTGDGGDTAAQPA